MIQELMLASQSFQSLRTLLTAAKELSNYNEIVAAVSEVSGKLMQANTVALAAQEKQSALTERIRALEDEVRNLKHWERESERYVLHELGPGVLAYALKPGMENGEPPHYLCPTCYTKSQKVFLQVSSRDPLVGTSYLCHTCSTRLNVRGNDRPQVLRRPPQRGGPTGWMG